MSETEIVNLPVQAKNNPLDGTEFNNRFIFRSNDFLNASQSILEGENPLPAKYREMTINEQRLFMLTLLKITPNLIDDANKDKPFEINIIPTSTMLQIFQGNKKYYETLKEAASALYNLSVDLSDEISGPKSKATGISNFHKKRIFDEMKFGPDYGGLYFRFAEAVRPYIYDLYGKQYTKIAGRLVFSLNSTYGIRLLELLLQYQNIKEFQRSGEIRRTFEVEEFKRIFCLHKNKSYQQVSNIKNRVIKYAINDINKNTKYRIEYEDIKEGRSIKKFVFRMKLFTHDKGELVDVAPTVELVLKDSTKKKYIDIHDERYTLRERLMSYGIGPRISQKLVQAHSAYKIMSNVEYALQRAPRRNTAGYIRKAIENDYASSQIVADQCKPVRQPEIFCSSQTSEHDRKIFPVVSDVEEVVVQDESVQNESLMLRSELGMAIARRERISKGKYQRAKELGLIQALEGMAALCEVRLDDLVR